VNLELFNRVVFIWIIIAIVIFITLLFIPAPYGRLKSNKWGVMISSRVSWIVMEFPSLAAFCYFYFRGNSGENLYSTILASFWILHYAHRTFIFPFRIRDRVKKMPLAISIMAIFFNLMNGFINGFYLGNIFPAGREFVSPDTVFITGMILFLAGAAINLHSDHVLINLRKNNGDNYTIPYGGMFAWVSCPNYFGEIMEWLGYAVMAWSLPALSFFIWTFANLVPRAIHYQRWYRKNFADYPVERKAVFPFIL
jgi:protein-S-isoprenylcysteine O-methyltransferase Ste14